jgi:hypothetical protein
VHFGNSIEYHCRIILHTIKVYHILWLLHCASVGHVDDVTKDFNTTECRNFKNASNETPSTLKISYNTLL